MAIKAGAECGNCGFFGAGKCRADPDNPKDANINGLCGRWLERAK